MYVGAFFRGPRKIVFFLWFPLQHHQKRAPPQKNTPCARHTHMRCRRWWVRRASAMPPLASEATRRSRLGPSQFGEFRPLWWATPSAPSNLPFAAGDVFICLFVFASETYRHSSWKQAAMLHDAMKRFTGFQNSRPHV